MTLRRNTGGIDVFMFDMEEDNVKRTQINYQIRRKWNALPRRVRQCDDIIQFKKKLKTELFSKL